MKRWIAVIVIFALAGLTTGYLALAPRAAHATGSLRQLLDTLDQRAADLVSLLGRTGALIAPLALALVLSLAVLLAARFARRKPAPGPVWRPEPLTDEQRIAGPHGRFAPSPPTTGEPGDFAPPPRPVVLVRKPRERGRDWFGDASWLGGLPRLGKTPWPRDENGVPLPFAAQIDLAELAAACPESPLPHQGSLAFFAGPGAVIPVPPGSGDFSAPPAQLPPADDEGGHALPADAARLGHSFFPYWPVEPVAITLPDELSDYREIGNDEAIEQAMLDRLRARYPLRTGPFTVEEPVTWMWWHGAIHLAAEFRAAMDRAPRLIALREDRTAAARADLDMLEDDPSTTPLQLEAARRALDREDARLRAIRAQYEALPQVIAAMDGFVDGRDPWAPLGAEELAVVRDVLSHVHRDCGELVRQHAPRSPAELAALSLRAMVSGPPEALPQIPDAELARINAGFRLANLHQHQVFGPGSRHHAARDDHRGDVLLLQLGHDDMMEWNWGELGLYQFWIAPHDLAEGRWDKVALTFEAG